MNLSDYTWRAARPDDLNALNALHIVCVEADGPEIVCWASFADILLTLPVWCALTSDGEIVAAGWAQLRGSQAMLGGCVHPEHRGWGLGAHLLEWSQLQSQSLAPAGGFLIRNESFTDAAGDLYAHAGFALDYAAYWMTLDLDVRLPDVPDGVSLVPWEEDKSQTFYDTYVDSFRDRDKYLPTSSDGIAVREPIDQWFEGYGDDLKSRPDLCLLAVVDGEPAGLTMGVVMLPPHSDRVIGWISQMGVRPAWRGRGIADGLIGEVGRKVRTDGLTTLGLDVNVNNPRAFRVYERVGFKIAGQRARFSKTLAGTPLSL